MIVVSIPCSTPYPYFTEAVTTWMADSFSSLLFLENAEELSARFTKHQKEADLLDQLTYSRGKSLVQLMKVRKLSVDELSLLSGISSDTIVRLRRNDSYQTTPDTIIRLCIALRLPAPMAMEFFRISGFAFRFSVSRDSYLYTALTCLPDLTIEDLNKALIQIGEAPLR